MNSFNYEQERKRREEVARKKREEREERAKAKKEKARREALGIDEEEEFSQLLRALGVRIKTILGDGNCMFRSLCDQLEGREEGHRDCRMRVMDYIQEREDYFSLFMEDDEPFDAYVGRMRGDGVWGGHQELFAASMLFDVKIFIHQYDSPSFSITPDTPTPPSKTIHLSYHGEAHYNSVRTLDDPDNGNPANEINLSDSNSNSNQNQNQNQNQAKYEVISPSVPWATPPMMDWALENCGNEEYEAIELLIETTEEVMEVVIVSYQEEMEEREKRQAEEEEETKKKEEETAIKKPVTIKRNAKCPCGSMLKYGKCCKKWDQIVARGQLTQDEADAARLGGETPRQALLAKTDDGEIDENLAKLLQDIGI